MTVMEGSLGKALVGLIVLDTIVENNKYSNAHLTRVTRSQSPLPVATKTVVKTQPFRALEEERGRKMGLLALLPVW